MKYEMQCASGCQKPVGGFMEEDEDVPCEGVYIGTIDDFHEFREIMHSMIEQHRKAAIETAAKLHSEKDDAIREDYENIIKMANRYADSNERMLEFAESHRDKMWFFKTAQGQAGYMMFMPSEKEAYEKERREFLVYNYA